MKRRILSSGLVVVLALAVLLSTNLGSGLLTRLRAANTTQASLQPDLESLLNYPYDAHIEDLEGAAAEQVIETLVARPEAVQLRMALREAGYVLNLAAAQAMQATLDNGSGIQRVIEIAVVPTKVGHHVFLPLVTRSYASAAHVAPPDWGKEVIQEWSPEESVAYLVAMVADDGTTFFQVHKTNLDPKLAGVPDPPLIVNGMPYFYITTLHVVNGQIIYWRYWWYDSNNHPNWYYAYYLHYWDYYLYGPFDWPWWYHWTYGWYYWRFWHYWSAWFPW